jgi:cysteine-rich repeat protein
VVAITSCSTPSSTGSDTSSTSAADTSTTVVSTSESSSSDTSSSSTAQADSSSSTGVPTVCGDGALDEGEECDDGNFAGGDACSSSCAITFEIAWTSSYDGESGTFDFAFDVVIDGDGTIWAVGQTTTDAGGRDLWVQSYAPDGTPGDVLAWDAGNGLEDFAQGATLSGDGTLLVTGTGAGGASGADIVVLAIDTATTSVAWTRSIDGPGMGAGRFDDADHGNAIAVDPDGNIVVGGSVRVDGAFGDAWIGELSPDGVDLRWEQTYGTADPDETVDLMVRDDGSVVALVQTHRADIASMVLAFDSEGVPDDATMVALEYARFGMVDAGGGTTIVVGWALPGNTEFDASIIAYDADWSQTWAVYHDDPAHQSDRGLDVAIDGDGNVIVVGLEGSAMQSDNSWVGGYHSDGTPRWGDRYNDEADLGDAFEAVAVDAQGDVVVAGYEAVLGQQTNAFLRKYHPL